MKVTLKVQKPRSPHPFRYLQRSLFMCILHVHNFLTFSQARYRYHNLTSILAEEIVGALSTTQAIDLSYNAIDQLPRTTSPILIALDVSYNAIERPIILHSDYHLVELNMCNNRITE